MRSPSTTNGTTSFLGGDLSSVLNEKHVAMHQRRHADTLDNQLFYLLFRWGCICLFLDSMHYAEERQGVTKQPCMPGRDRTGTSPCKCSRVSSARSKNYSDRLCEGAGVCRLPLCCTASFLLVVQHWSSGFVTTSA